jgi:hypothetical protein
MAEEIEGIKLIEHNASGIALPDDESYPWRLDMIFSPPEFMQMAFIGLFGNEVVRVRGMTEKMLKEYVMERGFLTHPRLIKLEITQPKV